MEKSNRTVKGTKRKLVQWNLSYAVCFYHSNFIRFNTIRFSNKSFVRYTKFTLFLFKCYSHKLNYMKLELWLITYKS